VGVCAAAAAQAQLPRDRAKWWSRPLVALLFLLQPVVRGWARYRGRLALRASPPAARASLDSLALRTSGRPLDEVQYWAAEPVDRLAFVAAILRRLHQQGWANAADSGWSDYDVEIYGSRWNHLQLTTVSEDHPQNRRMIRCRLRTTGSLAARIALGSLLALDLLLIGIFSAWQPWSWALLLTLPLGWWWLRCDQRNLQSITLALLDELARDWHMVKATGGEDR
jgi:hypothetical protein